MVKLSSIKMEVPLFKTNKVSEFAKWWPLFQAYAIQKEFAEVIQLEKSSALPETELVTGTVEHTKGQQEAIIKNKMGIAAFTIAFAKNVNEDCQAYVTDSKDEDWPTGQCHLVVKELLDEFAADDEMGMIRQRIELYSIHMKKTDNPKTLFSQITSIEQKYKGRVTPLTEEDKRAAILMRAPKMYQVVIQSERTTEKKINKREPTLKQLRAAMYDHYKSIQINQANNLLQELTLYAGGDDDDSSDDEEAPKRVKKSKKTKKKFIRNKGKNHNNKKRCYGCGALGHIKRDCPHEKPCSHCGKKGHTESECWKKYPDKRPKGMRDDNSEVAGIVVEDELTFTLMDLTCEEGSPWSSSPFLPATNNSMNTVKRSKMSSTRKAASEASSIVRKQNRAKKRRGNARMEIVKQNGRKVRASARNASNPSRGDISQNLVLYGDRNGTNELSGWTLQLIPGRDVAKPVETVEAMKYIGYQRHQQKIQERLRVVEHQIGKHLREVQALRLQLQVQPGRVESEAVLLNVETELGLSKTHGTELLFTPNIWIADTGASCHVTNSDTGSTPSHGASVRMKTLQHSLDASGNKMHTSAILDIKGSIHSQDGQTTNVVLKDCRYGSSKFNLCSITKLTEAGWYMWGDAKGIHLTKGERRIDFDIPIKTQEGKLWAADIQRRSTTSGPGECMLATPTVMSLAKAHLFCGHSSVKETKRTASHLGWKLTREPFRKCEACAVAKARQTNLTGGETRIPSKIGELYNIDGMRLKKPKQSQEHVHFPRNNCLVMAVEHITGATMIGWYNKKNGFIEDFCTYFQREACRGKLVKRIRCDDAGENKRLQTRINGADWKLNVDFEFTAKTPQRNSRVETKLFHMSNKTRAALETANVPDEYRYVLFALFYKWCCQTDMLTVIDINNDQKTRNEHLYGKLPAWTEHMQIAGMAGVVKTHQRTTPKVDARGKTCMFVCFAKDHAKDCYVMYDPRSRGIVHSRDVQWLDRMYFPKKARPGAPITVVGLSPRLAQGMAINRDEEEGSEADSVETDSTASRGEEVDHEEASDSNSTVIMFEQDNEPLFDTHEYSEDESQSKDEESDNGTNYRTRSGREVRPPTRHDGTRLGDEVIALHIEDKYVEETCLLGLEEVKALPPATEHVDEAMREEEYILLSLTKEEQVYTSVETAFGYINNKGAYMLVAAALQDTHGELHLVGATGHNYGNTAELNVMNYKQAMESVDRKEWNKAIKIEHDKMVKYNVFKVVHPSEVPKRARLFDSTWAMKKKPDGTFRARNAIRGFMQVDGEHYDSNDKSSPVATEVGIRVGFVLAIVGGWYQHLVDVEGAFLNGVFQKPNKHKMYMEVPQAYKKWYPPWAVFLLLKTQYGTVQAALQYYRECCKALAFMRFKRNQAEPCMFYKWKQNKLVLFVLWVDDCCISGPKHLVLEAVEDFTGLWDCKDLGELKEYVGCKVERTKEWIRLTQPVKVQRFIDEFNCKGDNGPGHRAPSTPAEPGSVLEYDKVEEKPINQKKQTKYRSGVGILLHMMRWSRPDVLNAVRELSSHMTTASKLCYKALMRVMNFIVSTKDKGYVFRPYKPAEWDGERNSREFQIEGKCDSEYAKHSSRRSVNAGITYFEGAIVKQFSKMMPIVALSTTEAELYSAVLTAQDMMFVYHIVINMGLKVKLPMVLHCDNKGAVALANNWSVGGRTRHVDVKQNFIRELKEHGYIEVHWKAGADMTPDIHTKNVPKALFDKYSNELVQ